MMLLEVGELRVRLAGRSILEDVSIKVHSGEVVALLGANASGKTTTLKAILGIIRPLSGSVRFQGREMVGLPPQAIVREGIAIVPEDHRLFPQLTIHENLLVVLPKDLKQAVRRKALDEVRELFPVLKTKARWNQLAASLSGGEQQQVAFARALLLKPKLLLMDEPSMGLSVKLVHDNFAIMRKLKNEGISMLIVEQNVRMILEMSDRGYVLQEGRVVAEGTSDRLMRSDLIKQAFLGEFVI